MDVERQHGIRESAADQEFDRHVIHVLDVLLGLRAVGLHPAFHQPVAHREGGGVQPVARLGRLAPCPS
jgi:hypothetical protein